MLVYACVHVENKLISAQIKDRYEFPLEIDLEQFLASDADHTQQWVYQLHGVLVHAGNENTGRVTALIKPDHASGWLKFEDEIVTLAEPREVQDNSFGGSEAGGSDTLKTAHMLVYIRKAAIEEMLAPVTKANFPVDLSKLSCDASVNETLTIIQCDEWAQSPLRQCLRQNSPYEGNGRRTIKTTTSWLTRPY
jgi:hypothetical protein